MKDNLYDLIYGIHPLIEIVKARKRKIRRILTTPETLRKISQYKNKINETAEIRIVKKDLLNNLCKNNEHQGIVAYVDKRKFPNFHFDVKKYPLIILFDGIQDPRNLGALLRSAYCTNVSGVIFSKRGCSPLTGAAFKASSGLAEYLEICECNSSVEAINFIKKAGYKIFIADFGGKKINEKIPCEGSCIVIGSEGFGISSSIKKEGEIVSLPQVENEISYNASVAGGIIMFDFSMKLFRI